MTVLTLNIHHRGEHGVPVPRIIQKICFDRMLARVLCLRAYNVDEPQPKTAVYMRCFIFFTDRFYLLTLVVHAEQSTGVVCVSVR